MLIEDVLGLSHIKNHLTTTVDRGRIPHAQMFVGKFGSGTLPMAIAYAQYILCQNQNGDNSKKNACTIKCNQLTHPDLHFAYPVATTPEVKKHPVSSHFAVQWRNFVKRNPYATLYDWYQYLQIENKQGQIGVDEAAEIVKKLALKSYEGHYKIMIIWCADKMNIACANKLLKLIEEPPSRTLFILITEEENALLQTIQSRCQIVKFPPLSESAIGAGLKKTFDISASEAQIIAHKAEGSFTRALDLYTQKEENDYFEGLFIDWLRTAFKAKGNKTAVNDLLVWSEKVAGMGREAQKQFLHFGLSFCRQALLQNYGADGLVFYESKNANFSLEKFAPFVHGANIIPIVQLFEEGIYHVERNGNAKILFSDISIRMTKLLHQ